MSLLEKARMTRSLDPESTDRITGWWRNAYLGDIELDMPYISHIWGKFWVGGVDDYIRLPEHFRNVFQLYSGCDYVIDHEPVEVWKFHLKDSLDQDMSEIDLIARVAVLASQFGDTLIHCQAGMNRSALVMSRVLQMNGFTPEESVAMIRDKRTPYALCNPTFERWTLEHPIRGREET